MAEGVRSMIVHDVFVTCEARQDKAEKFIPTGGRVVRSTSAANAPNSITSPDRAPHRR
jgi:hypothetical protein